MGQRFSRTGIACVALLSLGVIPWLACAAPSGPAGFDACGPVQAGTLGTFELYVR